MLGHRIGMGIVAIACATAPGCTWVHDRANDLLDPFRIDVGYGPGLYVDARVTDFAALGAGMHGLLTAGVHGRFVGTGELVGVGVPLVMLGWVVNDMHPVLCDGSDYDENRDVLSTQIVVQPAVRFGHGDSTVTPAQRDVRVADLGASLTLGFVGVSVGFSPGELLDCMLGLVGIDLAGDDVAGRPSVAVDGPDATAPTGTR